MSSDMISALNQVTTLYLTTYSPSGKSGTVPIWFFLHHDQVYFCTQRDSLKVRRIRQTGRARIHLGRRNGLGVDCTAQVVDHDATLVALLLRIYRRRYWFRWLFLGPRLKRAFAQGEELIVQLIPQLEPGASAPVES